VEVMMADRVSSISRRRVLGAAAAFPILASLAVPVAGLAAPPDRRLWNRRLARYLRLAAMAEEVATTGWFASANARHASVADAIKARFGSWEEARRCPEGSALCDPAWDRIEEAEGAYWDRCTAPMQKAAVALALTAAPDLDGIRTKIGIILAHQLDELDSMCRHPLDVILEDIERL
jgi:hypothetical protein